MKTLAAGVLHVARNEKKRKITKRERKKKKRRKRKTRGRDELKNREREQCGVALKWL